MIDIPEEPRIPLYNYLLDLVESRDKKEASVYITNCGWLVEELWNDIIPKNRQGKKTRYEIANILDISSTMIYAYKNNRKAISVQMLYKLLLLWKGQCKKTDYDVQKKWQQLFELDDWKLSTHSKHHDVQLPKHITPKLSYFMGWFVGDGHMNEAGSYLIKISEKSTYQLNHVLRPLFIDLFSVNPPIFRRYMGGFALQVGCKPLYRFIKNVLKLKVGVIPEIVWQFDSTNKIHFLMGVFDSEGHVIPTSPNHRVVISQSDLDFLNDVRKLFLDVGIIFLSPVKHTSKLGIWHSIQIRKKSDLLKFCSKARSYHVDKNKKIHNLVKEIEQKR
jgi:hypothetical protein